MDWNNVSWWEVLSALREVRHSRDLLKRRDTLPLPICDLLATAQVTVLQAQKRHQGTFLCCIMSAMIRPPNALPYIYSAYTSVGDRFLQLQHKRLESVGICWIKTMVA